jgi:hypothetical protein
MEVRDFTELGPTMTEQDARELAAKYAMHAVRATEYALACLYGEMTLEQAQEEYRNAMENYETVVSTGLAYSRGNAAELAKGADAVREIVERAHG